MEGLLTRDVAVMEPLHNLASEEAEEDGSGMSYSDSSSVASSNTVG